MLLEKLFDGLARGAVFVGLGLLAFIVLRALFFG
jgi:hypothetical protein